MRVFAVLSAGVLLLASACSNMGPSGAGPASTTAAVPVPASVFFLKDSANISASDGADVIAKTAERAKVPAVTRITVIGYADVYGPVNYNQVLAQSRAMAVKNALVAAGVTKPIDAHGATAAEHFDAGMAGDQGIADRRATINLISTPGTAAPRS